MVNANLRILTWNKGAQRLLGYSASEVLNRHCYDVIGGRLPSGKLWWTRVTVAKVPSLKLKNIGQRLALTLGGEATKRRVCHLLLAGCALLLLPAVGAAQKPDDIIPGRFLVTFRANVPAPSLMAQELSRAHGFRVRHVYRFALRGMAIEVPAKAEEKVLRALRRNPRVRTIGHDRYLAPISQEVPKGVDRINAEPGVGANTASGIKVAIIDTGLDFNHADLADNINRSLSVTCVDGGGSCVPGGQDDRIRIGHGTFVGGIVAAIDNSIDVVGVASRAELLAVKVCNSEGRCPITDVVAGLDYLTGLAQAGTLIEVANMSIGRSCSVCTDDSTDPTIMAYHDAVRELVNAGTTIVVAAGNDGVDAFTWVPASFDEVITVSALTDTDGQPGGTGKPKYGSFIDDTFAGFSNYGADIDVIAPGVQETSLKRGGGTTRGSGTSYSSPHAAGVAAIFIWDRLDKEGSRPLPATVRQALIQTGECHEGSGSIFHGTEGCSEVWPGDPDGIAEPLVRADNIANFGPPPVVSDVAVTSISVPSPVLVDAMESVDVGVANQGTQEETFSVNLSDDAEPSSVDDSPQSVTLAAGASTTVSFSWMPHALGDHVLTATAGPVTGETDTADNEKFVTVSVLVPTHDVAVTSISAPASVTQGTAADITVEVANEGTFDESFTVSVTDTPPSGGTPGTVNGAQTVFLAVSTSMTLSYTWDTTDASTGNHILRATASSVPGEGDTEDNSKSTTSSVTVPSADPTVSSIEPDTMQPGTSVYVTIGGSNFSAGATVTFEGGQGPAPTASSVEVVDANTITAWVTVKAGGPRRNRVWAVVVTNPDGKSGWLEGGFTVAP